MATPRAMTLPRLRRGPWDPRELAYGAAAAAAVGVILATDHLKLAALVAFGLAVMLVAVSRWPAGMLCTIIGITAFEGTLRAYGGASLPLTLIVTGTIGAFALLTLWSYVSGRRRHAVRTWPGILGLVLWLLATAVLVALSDDIGAGIEGYRYELQYFVLFLALAYGQWPAERRHRAIKGIIAIACAAVAYAALRQLTGPSARELSAVSAYEVVDDQLSLIGSFGGRQALAGWFAVITPLLLVSAFAVRPRFRIPVGAASALAVLAILWSDTRIGLPAVAAGGAAAAMLVLGARASRGRRTLIAIGLIAGLLFGVTAYTATIGSNQSSSNRYAKILTPSEDGSGDAHLRKWEQTVRDLRGHPLGMGMGSAGRAYLDHGRFINADTFIIDSSYLVVAYQLGFAMMGVLFAALLAMAFSLARGAMVTPERWDHVAAVGACGALAAWFVLLSTSIFLELQCTLVTFALAGLAAMPLLTRERTNGADGRA